jgi:hypothetical protein
VWQCGVCETHAGSHGENVFEIHIGQRVASSVRCMTMPGAAASNSASKDSEVTANSVRIEGSARASVRTKDTPWAPG